MMKLIQNIDIYAPQYLGKKDVLTINDKIVKIKDAGSISIDYFCLRKKSVCGYRTWIFYLNNLIVPTSGCLIGSLAIAKIEWSNWIKFMWKFLGVLMIGAIITVLIAVGIGF